MWHMVQGTSIRPLVLWIVALFGGALNVRTPEVSDVFGSIVNTLNGDLDSLKWEEDGLKQIGAEL